MKKYAVLVLCLMFVLSACSSGSKEPAKQPAASDAKKEPAKQETVVLKSYMYGTGTAKDLFDAINKKFEAKYPNIKIENEMAPSDQFDTVIKTKLASGDIPDLFGIRPGTAGQSVVDAGYLLDVTGESWVAQMNPSLTSTLTYGGKVYGIALENNFIATVYNKKMFDELGLKVPTTWDEFIAVCEALKKAGKIPMALGLKTPYVNQVLPYVLAASIVNLQDPETDKKITAGKTKFADSAWKEVFKRVLDMKDKGYFNEGATGTSYDQAVQLFTTEKAAMITNGNWVLGSITGAKPDMELGVMPIPGTNKPAETRVSSTLIVAMGGSAKTKHTAEVKKYLQFLAEPGTLNDYLKARGALSPFKNVVIDPHPSLKMIGQYLTEGRSSDFSGQNWPRTLQDKFTSEAQALYSGAVTIDQMMAHLDQENATLLKK